MDDPTPVPRRSSDARAWFYLDHRQDIEEWAALRSEGRELLHTCLLELGPAVQQLAADVGGLPYQADLDPGDRPRIGLRRERWQSQGHQVAVVVEWQYAKLLNPLAANQWPYVAVRNDGGDADPSRGRQLEVLFADLRAARGGQVGTPWPFWRYVIPDAGPSVHPDALVSACLRELRSLWEAAAPILDEAHR